MAGSYHHCKGKSVRDFNFETIENLGDAYEACEEMFWMIYFLANGDKKKIQEASDNFYKMKRAEPYVKKESEIIRSARQP